MSKQIKLVPFSSLFSLGRGLNITKADYVAEGCPCLSYGDIHSRYKGFVDAAHDLLPKVAKDYVKSNAASLLKNGDIVFADTSEDYEGSGDATCIVGCSDYLFAGYHTTIAKPKDRSKIFSPYFGYYFQTPHFRNQIVKQINGIKVYSITNKILNSTRVPLPPLKEQQDKASYLQKKTAAIDSAISRLLDLSSRVRTYRQSLITRAVTKGLDPNVPTKDAGLIWLGRIPEHWSYMRLAHCFTSVNRPANLDLPVLSVSIHTGISESELRDEERDRKVWLSEDRSKYQNIKEGDLVYNMMRAWQGGFGTSTRSGLVSPAYTVLSPNNGICSKYYELLFRTPNAQKMIYGYSQGIADFRKRLYWEKARDIYVPVPPYGEQLQIVNEVSKIEKRIETTKEIISKQIKLIAEYRESLISSFFASHDKS